jgi:hypothetical protein
VKKSSLIIDFTKERKKPVMTNRNSKKRSHHSFIMNSLPDEVEEPQDMDSKSLKKKKEQIPASKITFVLGAPDNSY